jgi:hypothetical protein
MEEISYTVSINGQRAVNRAYEIIGNHCYTGIYINSVRVAQMEVVLDEEGEYNGWLIKWVDVSYINETNIDAVICELSNMGFSGCKAVLMEDRYDGYGCICKQKEVREFIIPEPTKENPDKFHDIETDEILTERELLTEYNESDERHEMTFGQYVNNCLTINGGTLKRI